MYSKFQYIILLFQNILEFIKALLHTLLDDFFCYYL